jgi:hypothetical protein
MNPYCVNRNVVGTAIDGFHGVQEPDLIST